MMTEKPPAEPSMDEILASIRQIISSDSKEDTNSFFPPHEETEDILDLTDILPEDLEPAQVHTLSPETHVNGFEDWSPSINTSNVYEKKGRNLEGMPQASVHEPAPTMDLPHDSLLSQETLTEASQAFHLLNKVAFEKPRSSESPIQGEIGGQTLDNLIREMLKPLLKEWLDTHLPSVVREVVSQQVEKIVRQSGVTPSKNEVI